MSHLPEYLAAELGASREDDRWWVALTPINGWTGDPHDPPRATIHADGSAEFRGQLYGGKDDVPQVRCPEYILPEFNPSDEEPKLIEAWDGTVLYFWRNGDAFIEPYDPSRRVIESALK